MTEKTRDQLLAELAAMDAKDQADLDAEDARNPHAGFLAGLRDHKLDPTKLAVVLQDLVDAVNDLRAVTAPAEDKKATPADDKKGGK